MTLLSFPTSTETTETPTTRVPWRGGWAAMPHTATRSALPNNAYRVLALLIGHMDLTTCEVHGQSAQRLAAELGWSTRTVERGLATLRKMGWVAAYPDPAPYRLGWLVYVVRQEEVPTEVTVGVRQECRERSDNLVGGGPTILSVHDQESDSDSVQEETPPGGGEPVLSEMTVISASERPECRHERPRPADKTDGKGPTQLTQPPAIVVPADAPTELTETEQLLLDTGFHPTTARAFRDFDLKAVRGELHKQDLLSWQPQEERDRRIGRLVLRWRRARPEVVREREVGGSYQEPVISYVAVQIESRETVQRIVVQQEQEQDVVSEEKPLDPWVERARRLRPAWTSEQQSALARALRHAPNDGAALVMAQVTLGVARRC